MPLVSAGYLVPPDVQADYGYQAGFPLTDPALGAEKFRLVPGQFFEVLLAVRYSLQASAAAANRTGRISILDGDGIEIFNMKALQYVTANQSAAFKWSIGLSTAYAPDNLSQHMPLFPFVMPSGWTVRLGASNLQAGDQITNIGFIVQQFATGIQPERLRDVAALEVAGLGFAVSAPSAGLSPEPGAAPAAPAPSAPPSAPAPTAPVVGQQFFEPAPEPFFVPGPAHAE